MAEKKKRKELVGAVPYGSQLASDGVRLEPNPAEAQVILEAKALRKKGLSLREIAEALEKRAYLSRAGKRFDPQQIKRMVR
jgi:hypothetical protein